MNAILHQGEASAIALAMDTDEALLIIDEQKGRHIARMYGIKITGRLGLFLLAKQQGLITTLKDLLDEISKTDFRLSDQLVKEALRLTGE